MAGSRRIRIAGRNNGILPPRRDQDRLAVEMRQTICKGTEMASGTSDPSPRSYPLSVSFVRRAGPIAVAAGITDSFALIENWLLEEASAERQMIDLLVKLIRRMKAAGSSVDRLTLHIGTLHPQLVGFAWVW